MTVVLNAANHDPAHVTNPDGLDLVRPHNSHLGFGHGIHFCLGVSLARMEAQIALGALLRRLPDLVLAVPPEQLSRPPAASPFRGLLELPVTFTPNPWPEPTARSKAHNRPTYSRTPARAGSGGHGRCGIDWAEAHPVRGSHRTTATPRDATASRHPDLVDRNRDAPATADELLVADFS